MPSTVHLDLPLLAAAQAQERVTHNEALMTLDALAQLSVLSRSIALPTSAEEGTRYIAPAGEPDADRVAQWRDGAWSHFKQRAGWRAWVADEARTVVFDGQAWILETSTASPAETLARLGVNTQPNDVNRLAVRAQAALFSHDAETGGPGLMRVFVNKSAAG